MTKVSRRSLLAGAAVGGTALAAPIAAKAQDAVEWRMQALWDAGTTPFEFEKKFVERVSELTDGNFKITLFSAGQLVPANQAFDAVRAGAFQLMKTFDGYEAGKIPAFAFTSTIPFGFPESDQYEAWFYEKGGLDLAREAYARPVSSTLPPPSMAKSRSTRPSRWKPSPTWPARRVALSGSLPRSWPTRAFP